jgi:hypothetical protein
MQPSEFKITLIVAAVLAASGNGLADRRRLGIARHRAGARG